MIVTLDDQKLKTSLQNGTTLRALIDDVSGSIAKERMVVAVQLNGEALLDDSLGDALAQPLREEDQVDFQTAEPPVLAAQALCDVADQLVKSGEDSGRIADLLHAGSTSEAVLAFGKALRVWATAQHTIAQCGMLLGTKLTEHQVDGRPLDAHLSELADKLRELRDALEAQDLVLLADMIQFELPDMSTQWASNLRALAADIRSAASASES